MKLLELLAPIDIITSLQEPFLHLAKLHKEPYKNVTSDFNIVLMPGGGAGDFKKWGHENFISVAFNLKNLIKGGVNVHVVLGPDEVKEGKVLREKEYPDITIHYSPSIEALCSIVSTSDLVIANDCGPSHIAQCLGVPFVGIYSHNNTEWFRITRNSAMLTPRKESNIKSIAQEEVIKASLDVIHEDVRILPYKSSL